MSGSPDPGAEPVRRVFLGLGANLGDRAGALRAAVGSLAGPEFVAVSPVYQTDPLGGPPDQPPYLNVVVELATAAAPRALLARCHRLEAAAGRVRGERWGPRVLDVDVLWIAGVTVAEPDLVVPHPALWSRRFVLAPLRDLAPDLVSEEAVRHAEGSVQRLGQL